MVALRNGVFQNGHGYVLSGNKKNKIEGGGGSQLQNGAR